MNGPERRSATCASRNLKLPFHHLELFHHLAVTFRHHFGEKSLKLLPPVVRFKA